MHLACQVWKSNNFKGLEKRHGRGKVQKIKPLIKQSSKLQVKTMLEIGEMIEGIKNYTLLRQSTKSWTEVGFVNKIKGLAAHVLRALKDTR